MALAKSNKIKLEKFAFSGWVNAQKSRLGKLSFLHEYISSQLEKSAANNDVDDDGFYLAYYFTFPN